MRVLLLCSLIWAVSVHALTVPEIIKKSKPACVTILVKSPYGDNIGHGSGFFYCDDVNFLGDAFAAVVTNYHVISVEGKFPMNLLTYQVVLPDGKTVFSTHFAMFDKKHDLALILIGDSKASEHPYLHARYKNEPVKELEAGQSVVVIGTPLDPRLFGSASTGIIAALRDDHGIQITAPISPGSSGSPVLDEDGDLIAVCEQIADPSKFENINFAIDAKYVVALYEAYHKSFHEWEEKQKNAPSPTPTPEGKDRPAPVTDSTAVPLTPRIPYALPHKTDPRDESSE